MKFEATIREVMNNEVKTVDIGETIQRAAQIMSNFRIGSVIVMGDKNIKGIVTAEDIVYKHVANSQGQSVSDIMTRDPITISPDKKIEDASMIMTQKKIKKLPVIENGKIIGIITASDIVKIEPALHEILLEQLKISRPGSNDSPQSAQVYQCEMCGNYSDEVQELDGVWICSECEELREKR